MYKLYEVKGIFVSCQGMAGADRLNGEEAFVC